MNCFTEFAYSIYADGESTSERRCRVIHGLVPRPPIHRTNVTRYRRTLLRRGPSGITQSVYSSGPVLRCRTALSDDGRLQGRGRR